MGALDGEQQHFEARKGSARGRGAVWAAALRPDQDSIKIRDRMLELGAITRAINDCNTFCPPFVITDAQIDSLLDAFATAAGGK